MKPSQIIALIAIATLVAACFIPWMRIDDPAITITGVDTTGTNFGKPALNHLILTAFILLFTFVPKMGAKRANLFFAALNLAWAIKNYAVIPRCEGGNLSGKIIGAAFSINCFHHYDDNHLVSKSTAIEKAGKRTILASLIVV